MPRYDAILFDFDGVIADTEPLHFRCWERILSPFGVELHWDYYARNCIGISEHATIEVFRKLASPPIDFDALWAEYPAKKDCFRASVAHGIPLAPGLPGLLDELRGRYRMAVVSSSARREVEPALEIAGIRPYFDVLVCGSEAAKLKPAPDPYLLAAKLLNATHPLVIEDSDAGVASARAAAFDFVKVASTADVVRDVRERIEVS